MNEEKNQGAAYFYRGTNPNEKRKQELFAFEEEENNSYVEFPFEDEYNQEETSYVETTVVPAQEEPKEKPKRGRPAKETNKMENEQKKKLTRIEYVKILLVGDSGTGKTYSLKDLNKKTTGYINADDQPLSFKGMFKYQTRARSYVEGLNAFKEYLKNPEIDLIVIDSQTMLFNKLYNACRKKFVGWEVMNNFNQYVFEFVEEIKKAEKDIICIGHVDYANENENRVKQFTSVPGNVYGKGKYEMHFVITLYADKEFDDTTGNIRYFFWTSKPDTTCKSPHIFLDENGEPMAKIPNDMNWILEKAREFYSVEL